MRRRARAIRRSTYVSNSSFAAASSPACHCSTSFCPCRRSGMAGLLLPKNATLMLSHRGPACYINSEAAVSLSYEACGWWIESRCAELCQEGLHFLFVAAVGEGAFQGPLTAALGAGLNDAGQERARVARRDGLQVEAQKGARLQTELQD